MIKFEEVCLKEKPDWVVVVGDVNSTIAAGLVAKKLNIGQAHIEAGLRSRDRAIELRTVQKFPGGFVGLTGVKADLPFIAHRFFYG